MLRNYVLLALRNFFRNRVYTFINILGLSIGLTACIIIFLVVDYDLRFDKFHTKYDNIYRVVEEVNSASGMNYSSVTPYPLAKAFRNDFPEIPLVTQMHFQGEALLTQGTDKQIVNDILFADSLFFDVFDFRVLSGNPHVDLGQPGKVFLTKSLARKILKGKETAHLKVAKIELEVAGIIADPPPTSHINFTMIVSMPSLTSDFIGGFPLDEWGLKARGYVYAVLPESLTPSAIEARFKQFTDKYFSKEDAKLTTHKLQALREIHFDKHYVTNPGRTQNVDMKDLVVMAVLGIFILMIACINFINLTTALSEKKSKEIGIRKTLGAEKGQLTWYFLGETFLLTILALLLSLGATEWLLGWLNPFLEKEIYIPLFSNATLMLFLAGLILLTTLMAGFYPALVLSGFSPTAIFKNSAPMPGSSGAFVRKGLVVFQFLIAHVLIISTYIVADQMQYFKSKPLGFDKDAIVTMPLPDNKKQFREAIRTRLENIPGVASVSLNVGAPISDNSINSSFFLTEKGAESGVFDIGFKMADLNYLRTYDLKLAAGRWFNATDEKLSDTDLPEAQRKYVYILNESAVRKLGLSDPDEILGKFVTTGLDVSAEVVGVVKDFHVTSFHSEIEPIAFVLVPDLYYEIGVKIASADFTNTIGQIEDTWSEIFPEYYFDYEFLDDHLASLYESDQKMFTLFKVFAGVSIFVGCLGLYGLISFVANQKRKEIGIRKVMGASVSGILVLLSREFVRLVIIAFALATPLTWFFMDQWLQTFAYKVHLSWIIFLAGFITIAAIVILTIAYRAFIAARANPAITLRTE